MTIQSVMSWFSFVGRKWLAALEIFAPKNLKLFSLVSINGWRHAWKTVGYYFWWILILYFILCSFRFDFFGEGQLIIFELVSSFLTFLFFCALRPSDLPKNFRYFSKLIPHGIIFSVFLSVFWFLVSLGTGPLIALLMQAHSAQIPGPWLIIVHIVSSLVAFTNIFGFFFFLDAPVGFNTAFKSIIRGLKMSFYGLPFCLIVKVIVFFLVQAGSLIFLQFGILGSPVLCVSGLLLYTFALSAFNTFYVKRAHEDYHLYFKRVPESL